MGEAVDFHKGRTVQYQEFIPRIEGRHYTCPFCGANTTSSRFDDEGQSGAYCNYNHWRKHREQKYAQDS